jgi:hypothetical protein
VTIKIGTGIFQDHAFGKWPQCKPPQAEYNVKEEYYHITKYPDAIFDAEWRGNYWDCKRDGYGGRPYGNGSIFVHDKEGVTPVYRPKGLGWQTGVLGSDTNDEPVYATDVADAIRKEFNL